MCITKVVVNVVIRYVDVRKKKFHLLLAQLQSICAHNLCYRNDSSIETHRRRKTRPDHVQYLVHLSHLTQMLEGLQKLPRCTENSHNLIREVKCVSAVSTTAFLKECILVCLFVCLFV